MDRLELIRKATGRSEPFRLESLDLTVRIRKMSGRARAKIADMRAAWPKDPDNPENLKPTNEQALDLQCLLIADGLVDDNGDRMFTREDALAISDALTGPELDELATRILAVSGLNKPVEEVAKNSAPTPNEEPASE